MTNKVEYNKIILDNVNAL